MSEIPLYCLMKAIHQRISFLNSSVTVKDCDWLRREGRICNSREINSLLARTHFAANWRVPISDWSCCLVADRRWHHSCSRAEISDNLSGVTSMVKFCVSKSTPMKIIDVEGGVALGSDSTSPRCECNVRELGRRGRGSARDVVQIIANREASLVHKERDSVSNALTDKR